MLQAVASDFVALGGNLLDDMRVVLRNPSQYEESGLATRFSKKIEKQPSATFDTARLCMPLLCSKAVIEGTDVEIVF